MEKDHRSCPRRVFDRIFKAITLSSPALMPIHRICQRPQTQTPSLPAVRTIDIQQKPAKAAKLEPAENKDDAEVIHINFDYTTPNHGQVPRLSQAAAMTKPRSQTDKTRPSNGQVPRLNFKTEPEQPVIPSAGRDKRSKPKLSSTPSRVEPRQLINKEDKSKKVEDRFTEFINQTKKRLSSTLSNVGDGGGRDKTS